MDPRVCFLSDANAVPFNSISISHRKVVTYITFADNQVGPSVRPPVLSRIYVHIMCAYNMHVCIFICIYMCGCVVCDVLHMLLYDGHHRTITPAPTHLLLQICPHPTPRNEQENTEKDGGTIGHGTHVTSTVVGNSKSRPDMNGMAPAGKVAFFDIAKYDSRGNIQLYPPGE